MAKRFNHLNVPDQWNTYFTRYPQGFTILEALFDWIAQVDAMVDNVNDWNEYLEEFVEKFDGKLRETVIQVLKEWQESGYLDIIIDEALQTQMDDLREWTQAKINNVEVNPMDFGAVGDGETDDTEILQYVFDTFNRVAITNDHKVETVTIASDKQLIGRGGTLIGTPGMTVLKITGSNVIIDSAKFIGSWDNTYVPGEYMVHASGKDNGYQTAPTYIKNIVVRNCKFQKVGFSAVRLEYVEDSYVENNHIQYVGYDGISTLSGYNIQVRNNTILDITPGAPVGSNFNAYGIFFSNTNRADKVRYPRSEKCVAQGNYIENSPWEGIDTHGGKDISFLDNILVNVASALIAVSVDDEYNVPTMATENVIVRGNKVLDSFFGFSMDAPTGLYHKNVTIEGNQIIRCGSPSGSGGILVRKVYNVNVINNQLEDCRYTGIRIKGDIHNGIITGNSFKDLHSNSGGNTVYATCIWIEDDIFHGVISGNSVKTVNSNIATKVNQYGLRILATLRNIYLTGGTNYFQNCTLQPYFVGSEHSHLFTSPITQFGRYSFFPSLDTNSHTATISLKVPYSATSLFEPIGSVRIDRGEKLVLQVGATGLDTIEITVRTANGENFTTTQDIMVSWQTVGI